MTPELHSQGNGSGGVRELYQKNFRKKRRLLLILTGILVLLVIIGLGIGTMTIPPRDTVLVLGKQAERILTDQVPDITAVTGFTVPAPENTSASVVIIGYRLPRVLLAVLTGISLAVAGVVMQGLLRNPLVSPFTLGMSSAAAFGAAIAIVIGPGILGGLFVLNGNAFIIASAFFFGLLSVFLVMGITKNRRTSQATVILAGVVIGYLFTAGVLALKYISNNDRLRELVVWLMGGMWGASWSAVLILTPVCVVCVLLLERSAWDLNALIAGDDIAKILGIDTGRVRLTGLAIAPFAASGCLAFTGIIGFIGLMAPHICRMIIGNDYRYLIPCSGLLGAIILLVSDTVARTIMSPIEIPVGVIMYVIGGLFFLYLITKSKSRMMF